MAPQSLCSHRLQFTFARFRIKVFSTWLKGPYNRVLQIKVSSSPIVNNKESVHQCPQTGLRISWVTQVISQG